MKGERGRGERDGSHLSVMFSQYSDQSCHCLLAYSASSSEGSLTIHSSVATSIACVAAAGVREAVVRSGTCATASDSAASSTGVDASVTVVVVGAGTLVCTLRDPAERLTKRLLHKPRRFHPRADPNARSACFEQVGGRSDELHPGCVCLAVAKTDV